MEFPDLGAHCSEPSCQRLDFLPLKCDACLGIFCADHVAYAQHHCGSAYQKDIQVPVCPLCNVPVPVARGEPLTVLWESTLTETVALIQHSKNVRSSPISVSALAAGSEK